MNIDDGLLDEVFEDLPGNNQAKSQPAPRSSSKVKLTTCVMIMINIVMIMVYYHCSTLSNRQGSGCSGGCYYCVMGGSNQEGPVSAITGENYHCKECLHHVTGEDLNHHDHLQIGLA